MMLKTEEKKSPPSGFMLLARCRSVFHLNGHTYGFHPQTHNLETTNNNNNNIFISYFKYTSITPLANSKANQGRWRVDGLSLLQ